jgi:hypothetical protein
MSGAVFPIVDYDPPAFGGPPELPPVTRQCRRAPRPSAARPDRRTKDDAGTAHAAATFADAALRRILEVIDRRRPLVQLRPLLAAGLVESLLTGQPAGRHSGEPARLRRVRAQPVGPDGHAAEVSAHYSRGARVHAIACRIEQVRTATGPRWQVVALQLT